MDRYNVVALGECLMDMIPAGVNERGVPLFSANPGGAPANVPAMYAKLGGKTAFIGKVGRDGFGERLIDTLKNAGIATENVVVTPDYNTTLAFVHLDAHGDRSFSFYRKSCADVMLTGEEINNELLENCDIFHFGSVSLTDEPARSATLGAAEHAKESGAIISYDPNYRPLLWDSEDSARVMMQKGAELADIIKVSDEELAIITGETDYLKGAKRLADMGVSLIFVTLGADGAFYYNKNSHGLLKTYPVKAVDTTGAGDTFLGSVLWQLKGKALDEIANLSASELENITDFANAAGSLCTTKKGAIPAMPSESEIAELMEGNK